MRKQWVGQVFGSAAIGKQAGVPILLYRNLACKVEETCDDDVGRKVTAFLLFGDRRMSITNIYAQNQQSNDVIKSMSNWIMPMPECQNLIRWRF